MSRRVKREGKYSGLRADGRPFPEILVGITEIAAYLRKSPRAVSRWISEGMLPAPKDAKGRRWTTKGVIDSLVIQIYKAEMEHRPRESRVKVKGEPGGSKVIRIKPGVSSKQERASCPNCGVYEEPHNTGCPNRKTKPPDRCHDCGGLWPNEHEPACPRKIKPVFQSTVEPLELYPMDSGKLVRGRLIISEPATPQPDRDTLGFGEGISFKPRGQARVEDEGEIEHQERPV